MRALEYIGIIYLIYRLFLFYVIVNAWVIRFSVVCPGNSYGYFEGQGAGVPPGLQNRGHGVDEEPWCVRFALPLSSMNIFSGVRIVEFDTGERDAIQFVHRDQLFDRCLAELRRKGGAHSLAAKKADELISALLRKNADGGREQFRLTRNGEYRIKNCRKFDLSGGYRLVFLLKGSDLVLLYVGTHDDCFRWIERNKGLHYEVDDSTHTIRITRHTAPHHHSVPEDALEELRFSEAYEEALMERIDDTLLRRIFRGLVHRDIGGGEAELRQDHF